MTTPSNESRITALETECKVHSQVHEHIDEFIEESKDSFKEGRKLMSEQGQSLVRIETMLQDHCKNSRQGPSCNNRDDGSNGSKSRDIVIRITTAGKPLAYGGGITVIILYILQLVFNAGS